MEFAVATLHEAIAAQSPSTPCLAWRGRRWTWEETTERTRRLANVLAAHGLGCHRPRAALAGWETGQDLVGLYLTNGNAYLEGMLGCFKARAAPFNVNYRYVAEELAYLLRDAGARALVYGSSFAPTLAPVLDALDPMALLLQVDDGSGHALLPGALDYEQALAAASPDLPASLAAAWSPDDLYVLYTGGTTGHPKGVLWRQADFLGGCLGLRHPSGRDYDSVDEVVAQAGAGRVLKALPSPPFMHGAAHWNAWSAWLSGGTVVVQDVVTHFDPADVLDVAEREAVTSLQIVGDAFALPLLDELARRPRHLDALRFVISGGAVLSAVNKTRLLEALPGCTIVDIVGSSESGRQGINASTSATKATTGTFSGSDGAAVLDEHHERLLEPGDPALGWLARSGRMPLGYLRDPAKTARTFPVVDGIRWAVPGDRARWRADGSIELLGREAGTINTGGEKVFAEEVEHALKHHPAVYDALVVGRPSPTWGQEVVAVVALRAGVEPDAALEDALRAECARHLARYKLPKAFVFRPAVSRSPSGKPDYGWARAQLDDAGGDPAPVAGGAAAP